MNNVREQGNKKGTFPFCSVLGKTNSVREQNGTHPFRGVPLFPPVPSVVLRTMFKVIQIANNVLRCGL